ncbi:MAG: hypothetical protein HOP33_12475 [Verrucomicrobia bacterium]|nr:hypothetical protein [Verrucomicrobiota bacterium]
MSLINEALKRAKQTQTETPPPPLQFRGADKKQKRRVLPILVGAAVTLIFVGGLALLAVLLFKRQELRLTAGARTAPPMSEVSQQSPATTPVVATELPPPAPGKTNDVTERSPAPSDGTGPIPTFPGEYKTNSLPVSVQIEPAKATLIKLQGILFNPAQPSAIVNGRTVYVGNVVGGSRVTRITQETVTLVSETATNVLSLSE